MTPRETVIEAFNDLAFAEQGGITDEATLEQLGLDSLDQVELVMGLEERLSIEISDSDAEAWRTVGDVVAYAERRAGGAAP